MPASNTPPTDTLHERPKACNSPAQATHARRSLDRTGFAPGVEVAFPRDFREGWRPVQCVHGRIPDFVHGTYYLNGPAQFAIGGLPYRHWLDGDGMVSALRFDRNDMQLTNRYVRSTKFKEERQAGRPLFRAFGTAFPGDRLNGINNGLESPVNVSVYRFGSELLAFGEQGLPWALDPVTLETRGRFTFQGRLNQASPLSAHPKLDTDTQEMFNFGVFFSQRAPVLYFYCLSEEGLRYRKAVPLEYPCSIHDFSISKHYAVFYLSPYILDLQRLLKDRGTVLDSLQWLPEHGSRLMILDRNNGQVVAALPIGQRYCLHLMNSFERGDFLIVDGLEFDAPIYPEYQPIPHLFSTVSKGGPVRFVIDLRSREIADRVSMIDLHSPDFPAIDPRRAMRSYDDFWMLGISSAGQPGRKFFDQLIHGNWTDAAADIYQAGHMRYLGGEPVVISAPDSEESVVICQELDAAEQTSYFLLFDAKNVSSGPIARIACGQLLYLGFHAIFHAKHVDGGLP
jgi:all-trans-8'-apo-beta-carotenal 15,15'-oxygenase